MVIVIFVYISLQLLREVAIGHTDRKIGKYLHRSICLMAINGLIYAFHIHEVKESISGIKESGKIGIKKSRVVRALFVANLMVVMEHLILAFAYKFYKCQNKPNGNTSTCIRSVYISLIGSVADMSNLVNLLRAPLKHLRIHQLAPTAGHFCIPFCIHVLSRRAGSRLCLGPQEAWLCCWPIRLRCSAVPI